MSLADLKTEADSLGIKYNPNISEEKLSARIEEFYAAQETNSINDVVAAIEAQATAANKESKNAEAKRELSPAEKIRIIARDNEAKARKKRIVTINDNDNRSNNHTTTCIVNCGNEYFDLGTVAIPLNIKVEVYQGHVDALRAVRIPQHVKDPKDPTLSRTVLRPRYSIQYEDVR
jgi:hypothetical protein